MITNMPVISLFNLGFISMGLGICVLCFLQIRTSKHIERKNKISFQIFFALIIIYIFMHFLRGIFDGMMGRTMRIALEATILIEFIAGGLMAYMISIILLDMAQVQIAVKKTKMFLTILAIIHIIIMVSNLYNRLVYDIDEYNEYYRTELYAISNLMPLIMLIYDGFVLITYGENMKPKVRISFVIYIIAPVLAIILQSVYYGIQYIIFATLIPAVYMFLVINEDLNDRYVEQQQTAIRIGAELKTAYEIQASQLPRKFPAFPDRKEFDIYATMTPAKEVGGDFYDFFLIDDSRIGLVIADVSGKGIPAALFMMKSRILIKTHLQKGESPEEVLRNVNAELYEENDAQFFVTVWLAVIDISTGDGIAVNAGHEHPAIKRMGGKYELVVYKHFAAVGMLEGVPYKEHTFKLNPGDTLFVYTDGVAEATDINNKLFGEERMLEALNSELEGEPKQIIQNVTDDINAFVGKREQFDDITMLCFHYIGK